MPTNPFAGIITQQMKDLHYNMISALLEDTALTVPCKFYYGITKYESCTNCATTINPIGRKPGNISVHGQNVPFGFSQQCPSCGGEGKIGVESSEIINIAAIFNVRKFYPTNVNINTDGQLAQTFCKIELLPKIMACQYLIFDNNIAGYINYKFQRAGEPEPMGYGKDGFILTTWSRI